MAPESKQVPVAIVISAVDRVTAHVRLINQRLNRMVAPFRGVGRAMGNLAKHAKLDELAQGFKDFGSKSKDLVSDLASTAFKAGALIGGAAAGVFALVHGFTEAGDSAKKTAEKLGIGIGKLQEWRYAAELANISSDEFDGLLGKFSKSIGETAAGQGDAIIGFNALGISVYNAQGRVKGMEELLPAVADKLSKIQNASVRNAIAMKLFGKSGAEITALLKDGSAGLAAAGDEARRFGIIIGDKAAADGEAFNDNLTRMRAVLIGLRNTIAVEVMPIIGDLIVQFREFLLANKPQIAAFAKQFAKDLPSIMRSLGQVLVALAGVTVRVASVMSFLFDKFGAGNVVVGGLAAIITGKLVIGLLGLVGPLTTITRIMLPLLLTYLPILKGAFLALAAPIAGLLGVSVGTLALIVAAVVAAAVLIYKYWDPIKAFFASIWEGAKSGFASFLDWFRGKLTTLAGLMPAFMREKLGFGDISLGAASGAAKVVDATTKSETNKQEAAVKVSFENLPKGARVSTEKTDLPLDLNMGYAMVTQ